MNLKYIGILFIITLLLSGCVSYESLLNYNESPMIPTTTQNIANFKPLEIRHNDILHIDISGIDPLALAPFKNNQSNVAGVGNNSQGLLLNGYLVDSKGNVDYPTLGYIKLAGLTLEEATETIKNKLDPYFELTPIVNLRLLNFRVHINGEVSRSGVVNIDNPSITIVEAITLAGDFTDYSDRDSVLIIREVDGQRNFGYVSFNSVELFNSPYFYLQQNDVIYVRPKRRKVAVVRDPATTVFTWISAITGTAAFIISLISLRN